MHSAHGYSGTGHALTDAILAVIHAEAEKSPTGLLDSADLEQALLYHLIQNLRGTPAHYKHKRVQGVVRIIRELSKIPIPQDQVTYVGPGGQA